MSGQLSRRRLMQGVMSFLALSAIPMQLFARYRLQRIIW